MENQRKRPRILGTVVAIGLVGVIAIAAYSGSSLPAILGLGSDSPSSPTATNNPSDTTHNDADDAASENPESEVPSNTFAATVNYVHDGDTLYLDNGETELKVRLIGIDTPELASTQRPDAEECYGVQARDLLRDLLPEGTQVWALEDREPEDRYGRSLLYVYLDDGTFVNLTMIELGAAEALKVGLNDRYWPELRDAEDEARSAQIGMWGSC